MSGPINHFSDLIVYQKAFALGMDVFELSRDWPKEERYALTDQIRRSSRSVGANIAEAWAKRRYEAHFVSKLSDADAELHETEHWLMCAQSTNTFLAINSVRCPFNLLKLAECSAA